MKTLSDTFGLAPPLNDHWELADSGIPGYNNNCAA
jgi:hypothetical protein